MDGDSGAAVEVKRRRHLDEDAWREMIARFPGTGMTLEAFCGAEGVCMTSFRRWRARLLGGPAVVATPALAGRAAQPAGFIDLGELGGGGTRPGLELRLDLGGGISLHLVRS
jgi:hypothetical protein